MDTLDRWQMSTLTRLRYLPVTVCLLLLLICGLFITSHRVLAAGNTISIHITGVSHPPGFDPDIATVHVGTTLVFLNDAQPAQMYTIAADDQSFMSPPIASGQQWSVTISSPGTYEYHTVGANQSLVGTIIVTPATILLLPTPKPGVVATEIAMLRTQHSESSGSAPAPSMSPTLLLMLAGLALVLICIGVGSFLLLRRKRRT